MDSGDPQSSVGVEEVGSSRGGGGGAPPADAWQQAWRAFAPRWEQMRAKAKVSSNNCRAIVVIRSVHVTTRTNARYHCVTIMAVSSRRF